MQCPKTMNILLNKTLNTIEEEASDYTESFKLVNQLLIEYGEGNLAARLYSDIDLVVNWELVAKLFSILIWQTSDNGTALIKETEKWITDCENERKINIAINLDIFPFSDFNEMRLKLEKAVILFPSISKQSNYLINTRTK